MKAFPSSCLALLLAGAGLAAQAQTFACGGVGIDEQQRMKAEASGHDLMLTFATTSGAYMADVGVRIQGPRGGPVLDANCNGPIMLVDLPGPGSYRVTASANGVSKQKSVSVARGKRPATATFVWAASAN